MAKYVWTIVFILIVVGVVVWSRGERGEMQVSSAGDAAAEVGDSQKSSESSPPPISSNNVETKNGMKIETLKEGTGPEIKSGQTAVVQYEGKLTDGSVFDSTAKHGGTAFEFPLGAGMVIKGWDEGVVGMNVGETRRLTIPPDLGYGAQGFPPIIPANATLIFEVTLEGIK